MDIQTFQPYYLCRKYFGLLRTTRKSLISRILFVLNIIRKLKYLFLWVLKVFFKVFWGFLRFPLSLFVDISKLEDLTEVWFVIVLKSIQKYQSYEVSKVSFFHFENILDFACVLLLCLRVDSFAFACLSFWMFCLWDLVSSIESFLLFWWNLCFCYFVRFCCFAC